MIVEASQNEDDMREETISFGRTPIRGKEALVSVDALTNVHIPHIDWNRQKAVLPIMIEKAISDRQAIILHDHGLIDVRQVREWAMLHGRSADMVEIHEGLPVAGTMPYDPGSIAYHHPYRFNAVHLHGLRVGRSSDIPKGSAWAFMDAVCWHLTVGNDSIDEVFSSEHVMRASSDSFFQDCIIDAAERMGFPALATAVHRHRELFEGEGTDAEEHRKVLESISQSVSATGSVSITHGVRNLEEVLDRRLICIIRTRKGSAADLLVAGDLHLSCQRHYITRLGHNSMKSHAEVSRPWNPAMIVVDNSERICLKDDTPHHLTLTGLARHCGISLVMPTWDGAVPALTRFENAAAGLATIWPVSFGLHELKWTTMGKTKSRKLRIA